MRTTLIHLKSLCASEVKALLAASDVSLSVSIQQRYLTGSGSWSRDGCLVGSIPLQLRVRFPHLQTFLLSQPQSGPSFPFTRRRGGWR